VEAPDASADQQPFRQVAENKKEKSEDVFAQDMLQSLLAPSAVRQ
jgi:hypothetical protein